MKYLDRAIELARLGLSNTAPNPHVGAVIVASDGRIIGEGFHRCCGKGHAEVNAVASVATSDEHLLKDSTIYVTLEPCSHFGKTPPCAKLIIDKGISKVVVGTGDPNPKVNGKGIEMMRKAGVNVVLAEGDSEEKCRKLDPKFMSRFVKKRPYITLKWAQSADGFMASSDGKPVRFSTPLTSTLVHKLRSENDVILTSTATVASDDPMLDCRLWKAGKDPVKVVVGKSKIDSASKILNKGETLFFDKPLPEVIESLGNMGFNSVLVECGPMMLGEFIRLGLFDVIRVEMSPVMLKENGGKTAPAIPSGLSLVDRLEVDGNTVSVYSAS